MFQLVKFPEIVGKLLIKINKSLFQALFEKISKCINILIIMNIMYILLYYSLGKDFC